MLSITTVSTAILGTYFTGSSHNAFGIQIGKPPDKLKSFQGFQVYRLRTTATKHVLSNGPRLSSQEHSLSNGHSYKYGY